MQRRLLISYLGLTLVVLAVLEIPLALGYRNRLEAELIGGLERDAFAVAAYTEDTFEGHVPDQLQLVVDAYAQRSGARVVVVDSEGITRADSTRAGSAEDFTNREEVAAALAGGVSVGTRYSRSLEQDLLYVAVPVSSGDVLGAVRVSYATDQLDAEVRRYWGSLVGVAAVSLLAAGAVGVTFSRWVSKPLEQLQDAATAVGEGSLSERAPVGEGPPEVQRLTAAFNRMAARLAELVESQEAFVADASHQLRTPLTALRLRLENVEAEAAAADPASEVATDALAALAEVDRLSRLVDGLLVLARADRVEATGGTGAVDLAAALGDRRDVWAATAAEHDVAMTVGDMELCIAADPDRLDQILDNLISNAIEATPPGGTVALFGVAVGERVEVHVMDAGPGLTTDERERAFDRFWRAPADRGSAGRLGGSGLGLAIVRRLALADGAEAQLRASPSGGVDAVVSYAGVRPAAAAQVVTVEPGPSAGAGRRPLP